MTTITIDRAVVEQALEALKNAEDHLPKPYSTDASEAITALRAALAQEPTPPPEARTEAEKTAYAAGWWDALRKAQQAEPVQEPITRLFGTLPVHDAQQAEPPVDDPHRDHWVAIAEAAQKIAASTECGPAEAEALCAALDRLTAAALAQQAEPVCKCDLRTRLVGDGCEVCNPGLAAELAQQAEPVEPVAWMLTDAQNPRVRFLEWQKETRAYSGDWIKTPLYTAPPQRKPLTEEENPSFG